MDNPYESPGFDCVASSSVSKNTIVALESLVLGGFFLALMKLISYELTPERVELLDIPTHLRPLLISGGIYVYPVWSVARLRYRISVRVVQSIVSAFCLFALCLFFSTVTLAETIYWSAFAGGMMAIFAGCLTFLISKMYAEQQRPEQRERPRRNRVDDRDGE